MQNAPKLSFNVNAQQVRPCISSVTRLTNRPGLVDPFTQVLISSQNDTSLLLQSTDGEMQHYSFCDAQILSPGAIQISGKLLYNIAKSLESDLVSLKTSEDNLIQILADNGQFQVPGSSIALEPFLHQEQFLEFESYAIPVQATKLLEMIKRVDYALAKSHSSLYHQGLLFESHKDGLRLVAFDGYRLALVHRSMPEWFGGDFQFRIPSRGIAEICKLIEDQSQIHVTVRDNVIVFKCQSQYLVAPIIHGPAFNYYPLVEGVSLDKILIPKEKFSNLIRRMTAFDKAQRVVCRGFDRKIMVNTAGDQVFQAQDVIETDTDVRFDPFMVPAHHLSDVFSLIDGDIEMIVDRRKILVKDAIRTDEWHVVVTQPVE